MATIDLSRLTLEELSGIVGIYPWFAQARREQCLKMAKMGALTEGLVATAALYAADRKLITSLYAPSESKADYSDAEMEALLNHYVESTYADRLESVPAVAQDKPLPQEERPRPRFAGGDYFSRDEYAAVSRETDRNIFENIAKGEVAAEEPPQQNSYAADVCTETMAEIYLEQGYPEEAVDIYSKLILAYPEKSAYFAALIDKLKK